MILYASICIYMLNGTTCKAQTRVFSENLLKHIETLSGVCDLFRDTKIICLLFATCPLTHMGGSVNGGNAKIVLINRFPPEGQK